VYQIEDLMSDFGAMDEGDGCGNTIKYAEFVNAVEGIASRHPLKMSHGRSIPAVKARSVKDETGRRLSTPGHRAPVG
jgi:hypothetical protein